MLCFHFVSITNSRTSENIETAISGESGLAFGFYKYANNQKKYNLITY